MYGLFEFVRARQRISVALLIGLALGMAALIAAGQPLAAGLLPVVAALLIEVQWRDRRARMLAHHLADDHAEKVEVPAGAWGELAQAVNTLVQQQRVQERLQAAAPTPLPDTALRALLNGQSPASSTPRLITVLLASCGGAHRAESRQQQRALHAWEALAQAAQHEAQQTGALLQPCGDALMLVFGAFAEHTATQSAAAALHAADTLSAIWRSNGGHGVTPLRLSVTAGTALVAMLPGLGCCVLGAPVEQALQIDQATQGQPARPLICGESAYYTVRTMRTGAWQPLNVPALGRTRPLTAYAV